MSPATPYFQNEEPLEPKDLAGFQYLTAGKASSESVTYKPHRHFEYKGVHVMELDVMKPSQRETRKEFKVTIRVLVVGEREGTGQVVFLRLEPGTGHRWTSVGHHEFFKQSSGTDPHWCTGLQIKWTLEESGDILGRKTEKASLYKNDVHNARKSFTKAILRHFDDNQTWGSLDFEKVKVTIDENEQFLDPNWAFKGLRFKSPLAQLSEETSQTPARPSVVNQTPKQESQSPVMERRETEASSTGSSAANQNSQRGNQASVTKSPDTESAPTASTVQRSTGGPGDEATAKKSREFDSQRSKFVAKFKREVSKMSLEKLKALRNDTRLKPDLLEHLDESITAKEEHIAEKEFLMSYGMDLASDDE